MYINRSAKILVLAILLTFAINSHAQKMTAEEVITKHLDSIGTADKRGQIKNQFIAGEVLVSVRGSTNPIKGKALILSSGEKNLWAMNLASNDYPQDRFSFNGKDTKIGFARPGAYSDLGRFILSYKEILKEGLLGGTLSSSWALLNTDVRKGKISYDGTKKIEGKDTYVLSYSPKGGSDLSIRMFFDKDTYRHVRTEYNRVIGAIQGTSVDNSASQGESRYRLVEDFSNFQPTNFLTIPGTYKISYSFFSTNPSVNGQNANRELELKFTINSSSFNNPLEANAFEIAGT